MTEAGANTRLCGEGKFNNHYATATLVKTRRTSNSVLKLLAEQLTVFHVKATALYANSLGNARFVLVSLTLDDPTYQLRPYS